jgi:hypothetical protein
MSETPQQEDPSEHLPSDAQLTDWAIANDHADNHRDPPDLAESALGWLPDGEPVRLPDLAVVAYGLAEAVKGLAELMRQAGVLIGYEEDLSDAAHVLAATSEA